LDTDVEKLHRTLNGNGDAGVIRRLTTVEEHMQHVDTNLANGHRRFTSMESRLGQITILLVLVALMSGGGLAVKVLEIVKVIP
jgi:hypothetical protein